MPNLMGTEIYLFKNIHIKNKKVFIIKSTKANLRNLRTVDEAIVLEWRHINGLHAFLKKQLPLIAHIKNIWYLQINVSLVGKNIFPRKIMNLNNNDSSGLL